MVGPKPAGAARLEAPPGEAAGEAAAEGAAGAVPCSRAREMEKFGNLYSLMSRSTTWHVRVLRAGSWGWLGEAEGRGLGEHTMGARAMQGTWHRAVPSDSSCSWAAPQPAHVVVAPLPVVQRAADGHGGEAVGRHRVGLQGGHRGWRALEQGERLSTAAAAPWPHACPACIKPAQTRTQAGGPAHLCICAAGLAAQRVSQQRHDDACQLIVAARHRQHAPQHRHHRLRRGTQWRRQQASLAEGMPSFELTRQLPANLPMVACISHPPHPTQPRTWRSRAEPAMGTKVVRT